MPNLFSLVYGNVFCATCSARSDHLAVYYKYQLVLLFECKNNNARMFICENRAGIREMPKKPTKSCERL